MYTKKNDTKVREDVPNDKRRRYLDVSPGKKKLATVVKKKALRPKAERGNAVAVPRCSGQFSAAWDG
jgi:hypothetical protein